MCFKEGQCRGWEEQELSSRELGLHGAGHWESLEVFEQESGASFRLASQRFSPGLTELLR